MKRYVILWLSLVLLILTQCRYNPYVNHKTDETISNDSLLTLIQYTTLQYFWDGAEPNSGMTRERFHVNGDYPQNDKNIVTTGGTGFGLMAILTGIERKFITREEGFERFEQITTFLEKADRFYGVWPHWLDGETGKVKPFSTKDNGGDVVETSFLAQGMIAVIEYFNTGNQKEQELANRLNKLWEEIEWDWYQNGEDVLFWHWSPEYNWEMNHRITGYNECLITYVMAASSPTHPISPEAYHKGWARNGEIKSNDVYYGMPLELEHSGITRGGPLFWSHYSFLGLNPRNLKDRYADYWRHNKNHTLINRQYCIENPNNFKGYGENCWGLTASYSILDYERMAAGEVEFPDYEGKDPQTGYAAHDPDRDYSVISPTAALSSFPYTPEESMKVARYFYTELGDKLLGEFGFYDAFSEEHNWFPKRYLAIDQGTIVVMIENYRSGLLWEYFMKNQDIKNGLDKLGFTYE